MLNFIAKRKINKQLPGQGVATNLAHEHVHAYEHNEIYKGKVGADKGLGLTPVVLCFIAKKKKNNRRDRV